MSRRALALGTGLCALGVGTWWLVPRPTSPPAHAEAPAEVAPAPAPAPAPVPAAPAAPLPVAGWIIDGAGAPIAGVHVTVRGTSVPDQLADSERDGGFRVDLPANGERVLLLDGPGVFPAEARWHGGAVPPRIVLTRRLEIDARVTAGGAPVADAEVHLGDGTSAVFASARTGADGVARFPDVAAGPYELWAGHAQMVSPLVRTVAGASAPPMLALALAPAATVRGHVIADGVLPAGAIVRLAPDDVDHAVRVATIDAHGAFAIDGVPRGHWHLVTEIPGYFRDDAGDLAVTAASIDVPVHVVRAGLVTGTVVDADGAPVRDATLVLRGQGASEPATQGDLVPDSAPGASRLRWIHPLGGPRQMPGKEMRRFGALRGGGRPAECGRGHCGVDIGHQKGAMVHAAADGEVVTVMRALHPEAGHFVVIEHAGGLRTHYLHLDTIRADLEVGQHIHAGEPIGTVGQTGAALGPHLHFAMSQTRQGRDYYIDPEPTLEHAVVLADDGALAAPPPGAVVADLRSDAPAASATSAPVARFTTDARGAFRLDGIAPGDYVAVAFHPDLAPGTSATFHVTSGVETGGVTIALSPGVAVSGQVVGARGPISGARVIAEDGDGETVHTIATAYTDAGGAYVLRALAGDITLEVSAPGFGDDARTVSLDAAHATRDREDFDLTNQDARLLGEVRDPDGRVVPAATIRIVDGPTGHRTALSDGTGRFLIANVAAGTYTIEVSSPDFPPTRTTLATDRDQPLALALGGSLQIDLRDLHTGDPLASVTIAATAPGEKPRTVTTDARGAAALPALPPGHWTLRARVDGYASGELVVDVAPSRTPTDVRFELARGAILGGIVRDHYGRRVSGATVTVGDATTHTDGDGAFRLADVPTGDVTLVVEHHGARAEQPLTLAPGDEQVTLTVDIDEE